VLEPPRAQIAQLLERGIAEGQLPPSMDQELAMALLLGPLLYGHILKMIDRPQPKEIAAAAVDAFLNGQGITSAAGRLRSRRSSRRRGLPEWTR
jgi:tetracycline repressor-like protein